MAKRGSGKNGKKTVWTVLAVVSVLILIVCGVSIARQVIQIQQQRQLDGEMSQIARPSQDPSATAAPTATPDPSAAQDPSASPTTAPVAQEIDFDALHEENDEIVAWITLDGTVIDYPILCRPEDDAYYHTHNVKGQEAVRRRDLHPGQLQQHGLLRLPHRDLRPQHARRQHVCRPAQV